MLSFPRVPGGNPENAGKKALPLLLDTRYPQARWISRFLLFPIFMKINNLSNISLFCLDIYRLWITALKLWKNREKAGKNVDNSVKNVEKPLEKTQVPVGIR
jgi:hypothetical protein